MEAKELIPSSEIQSEYVERRRSLESQIDHLDNLIRDLLSHKIALENANRQIEKLTHVEQDSNKKRKLFELLRENIELLTKVFNAISELESIKYRYHKEIDDVITDKFKLIAIDIRKIDERMKDGNGDLTVFFEKLGNVMSNLDRKETISIQQKLDDNPEYKL